MSVGRDDVDDLPPYMQEQVAWAKEMLRDRRHEIVMAREQLAWADRIAGKSGLKTLADQAVDGVTLGTIAGAESAVIEQVAAVARDASARLGALPDISELAREPAAQRPNLRDFGLEVADLKVLAAELPDLHQLARERAYWVPDLRQIDRERDAFAELIAEADSTVLAAETGERRDHASFGETDKRQGDGENTMEEREAVVDASLPARWEFLARCLLPRQVREEILGDLAEDWLTNVRKFGQRRASVLYWRDVAGSVVPLLASALRRVVAAVLRSS